MWPLTAAVGSWTRFSIGTAAAAAAATIAAGRALAGVASLPASELPQGL
jgi:hypothetical protein